MVYVPNILGYKPLYIQCATDSVAHDTMEWGLVAKSNPYPLLPNPKAPYKNDWKDANGDDEYCANLAFQSMEVTYSFFIKTYDSATESSEMILRRQIDEFFAKISRGVFMFYDSYTGLGRKNVRFAGYNEQEFTRRGEWTKVVFDIKFKINDPITRMELKGGIITEVGNGRI